MQEINVKIGRTVYVYKRRRIFLRISNIVVMIYVEDV